MTTALVIVAGPRPDGFAHTLANAAITALDAADVEIIHHDLYQERFDPVLTPEEAATVRPAGESALTAGGDLLIERHRRDLLRADILLVAHPNWWGKPPAIMAGWIDRVIAPGIAYTLTSPEEEPRSALRLRTLIVLNTGDTPLERERAVFADPLDAMWRRSVAGFLGGVDVYRLLASPVSGADAEQRDTWIRHARYLARVAVASLQDSGGYPDTAVRGPAEGLNP
jgi:NAD(P)H dehydrogenase (quinone)